MSIYRFWSDAQTTTAGLRNGTVAWGGCYPHMQIIHKGTWIIMRTMVIDMTMRACAGGPHAWPVVHWKSISNSWKDMAEWSSDLSYSTVGNLGAHRVCLHRMGCVHNAALDH